MKTITTVSRNSKGQLKSAKTRVYTPEDLIFSGLIGWTGGTLVLFLMSIFVPRIF